MTEQLSNENRSRASIGGTLERLLVCEMGGTSSVSEADPATLLEEDPAPKYSALLSGRQKVPRQSDIITYMSHLPPFKVSLDRLAPGEQAYSGQGDFTTDHYLGCRTKLGGNPDYMQKHGNAPPSCLKCFEDTTFVAQIDSIEHASKTNPHSVDPLKKSESGGQKWMFGDVGMIYVFFCFDCLEPEVRFECG